MTDDDQVEERDLPAGDFATWVTEMQAALTGQRASDVPCAGCTACCTASQFVHVGPDEAATLARIPAELLFPAPGMPSGHVLLGYDERGHCPMLVDNRCSIYDNRPRTCRTYDCRILASAGLEPDSPAKALIAARTRRWRFDIADDGASEIRDAITSAARFLSSHPDAFPAGSAPSTTEIAVLAFELRHLFVGQEPQVEIVQEELNQRALRSSHDRQLQNRRRAPQRDGRSRAASRQKRPPELRDGGTGTV